MTPTTMLKIQNKIDQLIETFILDLDFDEEGYSPVRLKEILDYFAQFVVDCIKEEEEE